MNNKKWQTLCVLSGKGGVGKTTISAGLACIYAQLGFKVLAIDLDMGLRNLDLLFDVQSEVVYDLSHALKGSISLKDAVIAITEYPNLFLLASSLSKEIASLEVSQMKNLLDEAKDEYELIIIDAPAGAQSHLLSLCQLCDSGLVISTPYPASIRSVDKILGHLEGKLPLQWIINRLPDYTQPAELMADLSSKIDFPIIGGIVENQELSKKHARSLPVGHKYYRNFLQLLHPIALKLIGEDSSSQIEKVSDDEHSWFKKIFSLSS